MARPSTWCALVKVVWFGHMIGLLGVFAYGQCGLKHVHKKCMCKTGSSSMV